MTMTAEERIEAAKNYTVGTKVYAGRHGMTGRCTIVRIGPPPTAGHYGADWATATYDVRDERGAKLLGTTDTADISAAAATLGRMGGRKGGRSTSEAKRAAARANGAKGGRPRVAAWTVREVTERGAVEFSVPVGGGADGAEIIATLLPDNPEDEAVYAVHATWGDIGPLDGVDADLDTLAGRVAAALPRVGGWGYDAANGAIIQNAAQ